ncbi:MAG: hypothetical protein HWE39_09800 [Oceanospirillaceae bacterium]|nr:hypothetical protein [Oceanospirillaceae bacterium]
MLQELDGWLRRHLRKILWRQWKRVSTRAKMLMRRKLEEARPGSARPMVAVLGG